MAIRTLFVFSALDFLNSDEEQGFDWTETEGDLPADNYTYSGFPPATVDVDDRGGGGGSASRLDDGEGVRQTITAALTLDFERGGQLEQVTFPAGTQIHVGFSVEFSSGYTLIGLRLEDPDDPGTWISAGFNLVPPDGSPAIPPQDFDLGTPVGNDFDGTTPWNQIPDPAVVCFLAGTRIMAQDGPVAVEDLRVGDPVLTVDHGVQLVRWTGSMRVGATEAVRRRAVWPIEIPPGVLDNDAPLRLSRAHRVCLSGPDVELLFGEAEILVPAAALEGFAGVRAIRPEGGVGYHHFACDGHEIVLAEGAEVETLFSAAVGRGHLAELPLLSDLPQPDMETAARPLLTVREGRALAERMFGSLCAAPDIGPGRVRGRLARAS